MKRLNFCLSTFVLGMMLHAPAHGQFEETPIGLSPLAQATRASIIVMGKVVETEPKSVFVERRKGEGKVGHLVASIRIDDPLLGAKGLTHLRVGFVPEIREAAAEPRPLFL